MPKAVLNITLAGAQSLLQIVFLQMLIAFCSRESGQLARGLHMAMLRRELFSQSAAGRGTMPAAIALISARTRSETDESFDVYELAGEAADALEAYRRAPWRQLSDRTRMAKLRRAMELLQRIDDLENGRIPLPIWGD